MTNKRVVLAFYGWDGVIYAENLLSVFEAFFHTVDTKVVQTEVWAKSNKKYESPRLGRLKERIESQRLRNITSLMLVGRERVDCPLLSERPFISYGAEIDCPPGGEKIAVIFYSGSHEVWTQVIAGVGRDFAAVLRPKYGFATEIGVDVDPLSFAYCRDYSADDEWINSQAARFDPTDQEQLKLALRDVYTYNFMTQQHIERRINGLSLGDWIDRFSLGRMEEIDRSGVYLWTVDRESLKAIREELFSAGLLFAIREGAVAPAPQATIPEDATAIAPAAIDMGRRDALVARMTAAAPRLVASTPDEFFRGNDDPGSFWCNLPEAVPLTRAHEVLRKIAARTNVHDVRVVLKQFDGGESEWPFSDTILVVTSAEPKALRRWLGRNHAPDGIDVAPSLEALSGLIETSSLTVPPGMHILTAWWD